MVVENAYFRKLTCGFQEARETWTWNRMSQLQREVLGLEKDSVTAAPFQSVLYWQYRADTNSSWLATVWMQRVGACLGNALALLGLQAFHSWPCLLV